MEDLGSVSRAIYKQIAIAYCAPDLTSLIMLSSPDLQRKVHYKTYPYPSDASVLAGKFSEMWF